MSLMEIGRTVTIKVARPGQGDAALRLAAVRATRRLFVAVHRAATDRTGAEYVGIIVVTREGHAMSPTTVNGFSWIAVGVLVVTLAAVGLVDLYLIRWGSDGGPTVSSTIWELARDYPVVVLLAGILIGHLFWPQHR